MGEQEVNSLVSAVSEQERIIARLTVAVGALLDSIKGDYKKKTEGENKAEVKQETPLDIGGAIMTERNRICVSNADIVLAHQAIGEIGDYLNGIRIEIGI